MICEYVTHFIVLKQKFNFWSFKCCHFHASWGWSPLSSAEIKTWAERKKKTVRKQSVSFYWKFAVSVCFKFRSNQSSEQILWKITKSKDFRRKVIDCVTCLGFKEKYERLKVVKKSAKSGQGSGAKIDHRKFVSFSFLIIEDFIKFIYSEKVT